MSSWRYTQRTDLTPAHRDQGQQQAEISRQRYHYLCAAANHEFSFMDNIPADFSRGQLFPRQGLDFSQYRDYALDPITGIKLHPRQDGSISEGDLEVYVHAFRNNWKSREGGIMYFVAEYREFWNMVLNYHSPAGTTGVKEWNQLLAKLKKDRNPKLIPCMFFAREAGCLDPICPFLHDEEACIRVREEVLEARRQELRRPTTRDLTQQYLVESTRIRSSRPSTLSSRSFDDPDPDIDQLWDDNDNVEKICSNPLCLKVQWKQHTSGVDNPSIMLCSRCKVTHYCSPECQKRDWKRHKKEPCLPYEEMVENDDLWTRWGTRKGTGNVMIHVDEDM